MVKTMLSRDARVVRKSERPEVKSPIAAWPLWKVLGMGVVTYGILATLLLLATLISSRFPSIIMLVVAGLALLLGTLFTVWAWKDHTLVPRLGGTVVVTMFFLAMGIWFWGVFLDGVWLWGVVALILILYTVAWTLPAISSAASSLLWREQATPQTRVGRRIFTWDLGLGLGGAGVVGASFGTSLSRTGNVALASLIVAVGMSAVAIFMAQGFSHQLWPRRDPDEGVRTDLDSSSGPTP